MAVGKCSTVSSHCGLYFLFHILIFSRHKHVKKLIVSRVIRCVFQGTLEDFLKINGPVEEPLVVKFTRQLLNAVDYLHTRGIIHRDIRG